MGACERGVCDMDVQGPVDLLFTVFYEGFFCLCTKDIKIWRRSGVCTQYHLAV